MCWDLWTSSNCFIKSLLTVRYSSHFLAEFNTLQDGVSTFRQSGDDYTVKSKFLRIELSSFHGDKSCCKAFEKFLLVKLEIVLFFSPQDLSLEVSILQTKLIFRVSKHRWNTVPISLIFYQTFYRNIFWRNESNFLLKSFQFYFFLQITQTWK